MGALEQIKKWRRQLHQIPEIGLQEYQTSNYLKKELDILELVLLLRSMEISIDEIKLILNNQFSIRDALKTKKSLLKIQKFN